LGNFVLFQEFALEADPSDDNGLNLDKAIGLFERYVRYTKIFAENENPFTRYEAIALEKMCDHKYGLKNPVEDFENFTKRPEFKKNLNLALKSYVRLLETISTDLKLLRKNQGSIQALPDTSKDAAVDEHAKGYKQRFVFLREYAHSILSSLNKGNKINLLEEQNNIRSNEKQAGHNLDISLFYNTGNILLVSKSVETKGDIFLLIDIKGKKISRIKAGDEHTMDFIENPVMHLMAFIDADIARLRNAKIDTKELNEACASYLAAPNPEKLKKVALVAEKIRNYAFQESVTAIGVDYFTLRCISNGISANLAYLLNKSDKYNKHIAYIQKLRNSI
jgi:hypothetical protein